MSTTMILRGLLLAVTGLVAAGCQSTCTGDPRTDNLYCAHSGLSSGAYYHRTQSLRIAADQRLLASERAASGVANAQQAAAANRSHVRSLETQAGEQRAELAHLQGELARAETRLAEMRAGGSQGEIADLERQIAELRRQINSLSSFAN